MLFAISEKHENFATFCLQISSCSVEVAGGLVFIVVVIVVVVLLNC